MEIKDPAFKNKSKDSSHCQQLDHAYRLGIRHGQYHKLHKDKTKWSAELWARDLEARLQEDRNKVNYWDKNVDCVAIDYGDLRDEDTDGE